MNCLHPVKITLSDDERKRRSSLPDTYPLSYRFASFVYVPCGKCEACLSRRKSDWFVRLYREVKDSESCYFVTLTYDEDHLPLEFINYNGSFFSVPCVSKKDVQLFLKRLRKSISPFKVRYFCVSEYGPTSFRPHYHMILFDFPLSLKNKLDEYVENAWGNGFVSISPINDARISYCVSYCLDSSTLPEYLPRNFMLCSRKPGIGSSLLYNDDLVGYLVDHSTTQLPVSTSQGVKKFTIPRYYKDKIFDRDLLDKIAVNNIESFSEKVKLDFEAQKKWLKRYHYEINSINLHTAFPGSPLDIKRQNEDNYVKKVRSKNKMNKKKI